MGRVIYGSDRNKSARAAIVADIAIPTEASVSFLAPMEPSVVYVDVPVVQEIEKIVIKEVPVDREVIIEKIIYVDKIVEVSVIQEVPVIHEIEKLVEVPVEKIVHVERIVNIENIERALEERKRTNIYVKRLSISAIINVFLLILLGVVCVQR